MATAQAPIKSYLKMTVTSEDSYKRNGPKGPEEGLCKTQIDLDTNLRCINDSILLHF